MKTVVILFLLLSLLYSQSLNFVQEEIEVIIGKENCMVRGR
jgi:hypothetical protein